MRYPLAGRDTLSALATGGGLFTGGIALAKAVAKRAIGPLAVPLAVGGGLMWLGRNIGDAFVELAMEGGCKKIGWIKELKSTDEKAFKTLCHSVREDGVYVEAGENDNLIVQKLDANPLALGIFGFSFLDQNTDKIQGAQINDVVPEFETIADGSYPVSRPLYFYVKKAHVGVIPGMREYLGEFTSEAAWGPDGYLSDRGLIPMPDKERSAVAQDVKNLTSLKLAAN